jgi:hypothetical protein
MNALTNANIAHTTHRKGFVSLAMGWRQVVLDGKKKRVLCPLLNMVFAYG